MEIILKEDVPKLGRKGDVVKVADGYGRNFLLPQRKAIAATPSNLKNIDQMRSSATRKDAHDTDAAKSQAAQMEKVRLVFERRSGDHDTLFGSVTSMDIAAELANQGFAIDRRKLDLPEPIKTLGEFRVPVHLYRGVSAAITVEIRRISEPAPAAAPVANDANAEA